MGSDKIQKDVVERMFPKLPIQKLAATLAMNNNLSIKNMSAIQHGMMDGSRKIVNMDLLQKRLENPLDSAGAPVVIHTREHYKIYNCLKNMPHCIKSMEITRGDEEGKIGTNRPLENTICVAVHHLDDKTYGGLCVLREWGATDMAAVFVGSVELTRNGYDMNAAIGETSEMNTKLFYIAASYEKIMLEGDSITLACLDALSQVLYSTGCSLHNRNVQIFIKSDGECSGGEGWYQEEGKEAISLVPGTVITIPTEVKHWHGAKKDSCYFSKDAFEKLQGDNKGLIIDCS